MKMVLSKRWFGLLFGLLLAVALSGCQAETAPPPTAVPTVTSSPTEEPVPAGPELPMASRTFRLGTAGFIPSGYPNSTEEQWQAFFDSGGGGYGELFGVHINPSVAKNEEGVPEQVQLAEEQVQGVEVYLALGVDPEERTFTEALGRELVAAAVATARTYQPDYLSLGVENNTLYLRQPEAYDLYVQYARQAYDEIKAVSPETQVMNNFQVERMRGATALMGEAPEPHWQLIDRFSGKLDLVSFTVYPFLNYRSVSEIPGDYLAAIREHTTLPVFITETGWPSEPTASGVEGSEQAQIDYLLTLAEQANGVEAEGVIWVFPHDGTFETGGGIFDHLSLRHNDGSPKPAFEYWRALQSLPLEPRK